MTNYIIINWLSKEDMELIKDDENQILLFNSFNKATTYANDNLTGFYQVIRIEPDNLLITE